MKKLLIITSFTLTAVSFLTSFTNSEKLSQERNCQYGQCIKIKKTGTNAEIVHNKEAIIVGHTVKIFTLEK